MQDFIINAVIWILALYGLIEIIKNIIPKVIKAKSSINFEESL